jgi:hypothetical protein
MLVHAYQQARQQVSQQVSQHRFTYNSLEKLDSVFDYLGLVNTGLKQRQFSLCNDDDRIEIVLPDDVELQVDADAGPESGMLTIGIRWNNSQKLPQATKQASKAALKAANKAARKKARKKAKKDARKRSLKAEKKAQKSRNKHSREHSQRLDSAGPVVTERKAAKQAMKKARRSLLAKDPQALVAETETLPHRKPPQSVDAAHSVDATQSVPRKRA